MTHDDPMPDPKRAPAPPDPQAAERDTAPEPSVRGHAGEPHDPFDRVDRAFLIVGLGASAGGLAALESFFASLPADTGMAFVVVTHQHPEHRSLLTEILQRKTSMPVREAEQVVALAPNHVYVSMPGAYLEVADLALIPVPAADAQTRPVLPIDHFFRSLARAHGDRAVAIVLSGTGTDGTLGVREIKAHGGVVMVQEEQSAMHGGMPQSAIATSVVDFVLPAEAMAAQLAVLQHAAAEPSREAPGLGPDAPSLVPALAISHEALHGLFARVRARTGHDFSQYKENTLRRRIERRMSVHHIDGVADYVAFVDSHPEELEILFREMLIGVTSFFRDQAAFEALERPLDALLATRPEGHTVRVWVAGCSTGEEAYSIAILLREALTRSQRPLGIQVFASDLDPDTITVARAGHYPDGIAADVPPAILARYFSHDPDGYRVRKEIRDTIVFAQQNAIADPPFTKLDLIVCRNLMIYFGAALQQRLIPTFHYALSQGGLLFLGSSETLGRNAALFEPIDKKWRIFRRRDVMLTRADFATGLAVRAVPAGRWTGASPALPAEVIPTTSGAERVLLRELVPPTVICRERGEIVHVHGRVGRFLELAPGPQLTQNIFDMVSAGLELELGTMMRRAASQAGEVVHRDVRVDALERVSLVDLRVQQMREPEAFRGLFLVTFDHVRPLEAATPQDAVASDDGGLETSASSMRDRFQALEEELEYAKEGHRAVIADLETANEELKSSNEELVSTNEEIQSANEELETSREEMQSLNEELHTANAELQSKVEELWRSNDDMNNLLNATDIATLFLDGELRIKRYTEQAKRVIPMIPSDVGRPIGDLMSRLQYDRLTEDAGEVLRTLVPKETEVRGEGDAWYLMRILPYRTSENIIDGLVVTFVDVTKTKSLLRNERRFLEALRHSSTAVFGQDRELRYLWMGTGVFGRSPEAVVGLRDEDLLPASEAATLTALKREVLATGTPMRRQLALTPQREPREFDLYLAPIRDESGAVTGVSGVATQTSDFVRASAANGRGP